MFGGILGCYELTPLPDPTRQSCMSEQALLSGVPDYFGRNKISSGGDLSHYSSASLY